MSSMVKMTLEEFTEWQQWVELTEVYFLLRQAQQTFQAD